MIKATWMVMDCSNAVFHGGEAVSDQAFLPYELQAIMMVDLTE